MASRDSQTVLLSRQAILLVTAVGVGLLTLCYVLGVQVGKQSAALRHPLAKGAGEELEELPATMADQLKALEQSGSGTGFAKPQKGADPSNQAASRTGVAATEKPEAPKAEAPRTQSASRTGEAGTEKAAPAEAPARKAEAEGRWTLQIVSTPDASEAKRVAAKAKAAGFRTEIITEKGLAKVRLTGAMDRKTTDASLQRLKNHGFKPFAIKVD